MAGPRPCSTRTKSFSVPPSTTPAATLTGEAAQFIDGFDHHLLGYVVCDFDFADFAGQDEVHDAVAGLFVRFEQTKDGAAARFDLRQRAQRTYCVGNAGGAGAVDAIYGRCNSG